MSVETILKQKGTDVTTITPGATINYRSQAKNISYSTSDGLERGIF
jgi:hypothetical protein